MSVTWPQSQPWRYTVGASTASTYAFTMLPATPPPPKPVGPLDWLRDQVDEVCRLAQEP